MDFKLALSKLLTAFREHSIRYALMGGHNLNPENTRVEKVDQDSLMDCIERIERMVDSEEDEANYVVNITGGNKIMALGAFEVFTNIGQKVSIGYMALGKSDFVQVYPRRKPFKVIPIRERLNLRGYLACYGFTIHNEKHLARNAQVSRKRVETSVWILSNYERLKGLLGFLYKNIGNKRNEARFHFSGEFNRAFSHEEKELLERLAFSHGGSSVSKMMTKDEIGYVTGGWLEEYVFTVVDDLVAEKILDDGLIKVQLKSIYGSDSELDIAFVKENAFYHIECKTLGEKSEQNIVRDEIYKKGAISTLLGKGNKRAMICTTQKEMKESLRNRAKDYDVEILAIDEVRNIRERLTARFQGIV
jgi:hypothetical protein